MLTWIRNWALRKLWNAVLPSDVLTVDKHGIIYVDGNAISPQELSRLQSEVKLFRDMALSRALLGTPALQARKMLFEKATTWQDMVAGKMMLYTLDVQEKVLSTIEQGKPL